VVAGWRVHERLAAGRAAEIPGRESAVRVVEHDVRPGLLGRPDVVRRA
jgi:hypothetical protein